MIVTLGMPPGGRKPAELLKGRLSSLGKMLGRPVGSIGLDDEAGLESPLESAAKSFRPDPDEESLLPPV